MHSHCTHSAWETQCDGSSVQFANSAQQNYYTECVKCAWYGVCVCIFCLTLCFSFELKKKYSAIQEPNTTQPTISPINCILPVCLCISIIIRANMQHYTKQKLFNCIFTKQQHPVLFVVHIYFIWMIKQATQKYENYQSNPASRHTPYKSLKKKEFSTTKSFVNGAQHSQAAIEWM